MRFIAAKKALSASLSSISHLTYTAQLSQTLLPQSEKIVYNAGRTLKPPGVYRLTVEVLNISTIYPLSKLPYFYTKVSPIISLS